MDQIEISATEYDRLKKSPSVIEVQTISGENFLLVNGMMLRRHETVQEFIAGIAGPITLQV